MHSSAGTRTTGAASSGQPGSTPIWRPVADVVPMPMVWVNQPIGQLRRGYGPSPKTVAAKVTAFTEGMDRAGVATAVKHFPGLGRVRGNTDYMSSGRRHARQRDTMTLSLASARPSTPVSTW